MEQKHFINIERLKMDSELAIGNHYGFKKGDIIQITEKWDGSNACIAYDTETESLVAFSRKQTLSSDNTLRGFFEYVQKLNKDLYKDTPNYRVFGEWGVRNHIKYNPECYGKFYVYDIFDVELDGYLPQELVKDFCKSHDLEYIHELYYGEFISWDHCKTFCNSPMYGDMQEGIVVKNQTRLNNENTREPFVLKIVNDSYSEINKSNHIKKVLDPQHKKELEHCQEIVDTIVTKRRVEKEIKKMQDEGILPNDLDSSHMRILAQSLCKRIYDDCVKEESEYVKEAGDNFGKLCGKRTMLLARTIIFSEN